MNEKITYTHGHHPWATVATVDGEKSISVSIGRLLYDEEGRAYLLAFEGEAERRFYLGDSQ